MESYQASLANAELLPHFKQGMTCPQHPCTLPGHVQGMSSHDCQVCLDAYVESLYATLYRNTFNHNCLDFLEPSALPCSAYDPICCSGSDFAATLVGADVNAAVTRDNFGNDRETDFQLPHARAASDSGSISDFNSAFEVDQDLSSSSNSSGTDSVHVGGLGNPMIGYNQLHDKYPSGKLDSFRQSLDWSARRRRFGYFLRVFWQSESTCAAGT